MSSASTCLGRAILGLFLGTTGCGVLVGIDDVVLGEGGGSATSTATSTATATATSTATATATATATSTTSGGGGEGGGPGSGGGGGADGGGGTTGQGGEGGGPLALCSNGVEDGGETGIDCGGACPLCDGDRCTEPDQCASGVCGDGGTCAAPACDDGVVNGLEADVDCGVDCPDPCRFGQLCGDDDDCSETARCEAGRCAPTPIGIWVQGQKLPSEAVADPNTELSNTSLFFDASRGWSIVYGGFNPPGSHNDLTYAYIPATGWFDLAPNNRPFPRSDAAVAYDRARSRGVMFGGNLSRETWEWDSATAEWTLVHSGQGTAPTQASHKVMAYDEARGVTVVYGGFNTASELLEWNGEEWTEPSQGVVQPGGRYLHAMAFHRGLGRIVLYGGELQAADAIGDTWAWDGTTWEPLVADGDGPPARNNHVMAWDSRRDRLVMTGGFVAEQNGTHNDTWEFDGTSWVETTGADTALPPHVWASMVYDEASKRSILFHTYGQRAWQYVTLATSCEDDADCAGFPCQDNLCCSTTCDAGESCATEDNPGVCADGE